MEYRHLIADPKTREVWDKSSAKEFGRLMKGLKRGIQGTDTMKFIQKHEVPYDKKVTYALFICDYRPQKEEKERSQHGLRVLIKILLYLLDRGHRFDSTISKA